MSKYSKAYQEDHNIDWFARVNGMYCHFASGGTYLPDEVNDKEQNRKIQQYIARKNNQQNYLDGVLINPNYMDDVLSIVTSQFGIEMNVDRALSLCATDAVSLGFNSYCFWGIDKWDGIIYRLIASPIHIINPEFDSPLTIPELQSAHSMKPFLQIPADREVPEYIRVFVFDHD